MLRKLNVICIIIIMMTAGSVSGDVVIDESKNIPSLDVGGYYFQVNIDDAVVIIDIEVTAGNDISFYVTDEANGVKALSGQQFYAYGSRDNIVSGNYEIDIGDSGIYYIILDNTDSFTSTTVDLRLEVESQGGIGGFIIAAIFIGILVYVYYNNKKKDDTEQPSSNQQISSQPQAAKSEFCGACGTNQAGNKFCKNCGASL